MSPRTALQTTFMSVFLLGCSGSGSDDASVGADAVANVLPAGERHASIGGGPGPLQVALSLCTLRGLCSSGAGLYRVASLVSTVESREGYAGEPDACNGLTSFTYVELELVEGWTEAAPSRAIARIEGGPIPGCGTLEWEVSLAVDQVLGVLLTPPTADDRGYFRLNPQCLFHEEGGHYSNNVIFVHHPATAQEVGAAVRAADDGCTQDVLPDGLDWTPDGGVTEPRDAEYVVGIPCPGASSCSVSP